MSAIYTFMLCLLYIHLCYVCYIYIYVLSAIYTFMLCLLYIHLCYVCYIYIYAMSAIYTFMFCCFHSMGFFFITYKTVSLDWLIDS